MAAVSCFSEIACAQTAGGFTPGQVLTASALNTAFSTKQDYNANLSTLATGNGSALTSLNASNLFSGTVPAARVSGVYGNITGIGTQGRLLTGNSTNWIATAVGAGQIGGDDTVYAPSNQCLANMSTTAASSNTPFICGLFAVQSLNNLSGATPRALDLFSINNATGPTNISIWTIYAETHDATASGGNSYVGEFEGRNIQGAPASLWNPYQTPAGVIDLELGCGAGLSSVGQFNCNVAEYIASNPKPFNAGLTFLPGSVNATGGQSPAIQLPVSYDMEWWSNSSTRLAYLYVDSAGALQVVPTTAMVLPDGRTLGWGSATNQASVGGSTASSIITFNTGGSEQARVTTGALLVGTTSNAASAKLNVNGMVNATSYDISGTAGVTCSGTPTAGFASTNGIVTHC